MELGRGGGGLHGKKGCWRWGMGNLWYFWRMNNPIWSSVMFVCDHRGTKQCLWCSKHSVRLFAVATCRLELDVVFASYRYMVTCASSWLHIVHYSRSNQEDFCKSTMKKLMESKKNLLFLVRKYNLISW